MRLCFVSVFCTHIQTEALYYYRCIGSDAHRQLKGTLCTNRPIRQDYLDPFVWNQIIRLLEDDTLLQAEIDRRKKAIRDTDPRRQRQETLRHEQVRLGKNIERLITAYQEGLLELSQLRERMPELNKRAKTVEAEIQSIEAGAMDEVKYLQLADNLSSFREKLQARAKTLDVRERQQILRLLVKEILVDSQSITIRHSIPISHTEKSPIPSGTPTFQPIPPGTPQPSYLLRPRSNIAFAQQPLPQRGGSDAREGDRYHATRKIHPRSIRSTNSALRFFNLGVYCGRHI